MLAVSSLRIVRSRLDSFGSRPVSSGLDWTFDASVFTDRFAQELAKDSPAIMPA